MRGVAVPYVIALILGVAVIGLVGFWFATSGGKFGGQSAKTICDSKFLQWCITHSGTYTNFVSDGNSECNNLGSYNNCNELGVSGTGSGTGPGQVPGTINCNKITPTKDPTNCNTCVSGSTLCDDNCNSCQVVQGQIWSCRDTPNKCVLS